MSIETILEFEQKGIKLWLEGDKLKYRCIKGTISEDDLAMLRHKKSKIISFLSLGYTVSSMYANQLGYWADFKFNPQSVAYNLMTVYKLSSSICQNTLQLAFNDLLRYQRIMSSTFHESNGRFYQLLSPILDYEFEKIHLNEHGDESLRKKLTLLANRPFNLSEELLFRASLVSQNIEVDDLKVTDTWLVFISHHIITEIFSISILMQQLEIFYKNRKFGESERLAPAYDIADFGMAEREYLKSKQARIDQQYWNDILHGSLPILEFIPNKARPSIKQYDGGVANITLEKEMFANIGEFCKKNSITPFIFFQSIYFSILSRYTNQEDFVLGISIAEREFLGGEAAVGNFVNMLALRINIKENFTFEDVLEKCKFGFIDAFEHKKYPFAKVVNGLNLNRDVSRTPIFQTSITLAKLSVQSSGKTSKMFDCLHPISGQRGSFDDLGLSIFSDSDKYDLSMHYDSALFEQLTIEYMLRHMKNMVISVLADSSKIISKLNITDDNEKALLLMWGQDEYSSTIPNENIHNIGKIFQEKASKFSHNLAIIAEGKNITYRQLNQSANKMACYLKTLNVTPGVRVGFYAPSSPEVLILILAVIKCGAIYVPISLEDGHERVRTIVIDAEISILIVKLDSEISLDVDAQLIQLDILVKSCANYSGENNLTPTKPSDTACIFYTSGSTGNPKGVPVSHQAIISRVINTNYIDISSSDRVAHVSSMSFDPASFEIWGGLLNGATVVGISKDVLLTPELLTTTLVLHDVSVMLVTTAMFNRLSDSQNFPLMSVRAIIFGGEKVNTMAVKKVFDGGFKGKLIHGYGPTENTTISTFHVVSHKDLTGLTIPIGKPVTGCETFIVDKYGELSGVGITGELILGGVGLSTGYINQDSLTKKKFKCFPALAKDKKVYCTGDFARYNSFGAIEFIGRKDNLVKIRGFSIELEEIIISMHQFPGVKEAFVDVQTSDGIEQYLMAYCVCDERLDVKSKLRRDIRIFLKSRLSFFMLPKQVIQLAELPLNKNGKIDVKRLPFAEESGEERFKKDDLVIGELELKILNVWSVILRNVEISIDHNLWDIGANSINVVKAANMISMLVNKPINVVDLMRYDSIRDFVESLNANEEVNRDSPLVCINYVNSDKAPLILIHPVGGSILSYVPLAQLISSDRSIYAIAFDIQIFTERNIQSLIELSEFYVDLLQRNIGAKNYYLGGWSLGGAIALEMSKICNESGIGVYNTILIDSRNPEYEKHNVEKYSNHEWLLYFFAKELDICIDYKDVAQYVTEGGTDQFPQNLLNIARAKNNSFQYIPESVVKERFEIFTNNLRLFASHCPSVYSGNVVLLIAEDSSSLVLTVPLEKQWRNTAPEMTSFVIPGSHFSLIQPPNLIFLVRQIEKSFIIDETT